MLFRAVLTCAAAGSVFAFVVTAPAVRLHQIRGTHTLRMSSYAQRLAQAQAEKAAKAQTAAAPEAAPKAPIPFVSDDMIRQHLANAISILSTRLQSGQPLSRTQLSSFEKSVSVVVQDATDAPQPAAPPTKWDNDSVLRDRPNLNEISSSTDRSNSVASPAPRQAAAPTNWENESIPSERPNLYRVTGSSGGRRASADDEDESEGPAYDPNRGYGVAAGTTNTYVIEGMDSMTPDEYMEALRQRVVNRAQTVRNANTRSFGNIAAKEFLASLNTGGSWQSEAGKESKDEDFRRY